MMSRTSDVRAPAFQFYPDDYLSDDAVEAMSLAEQGAYMRLLCHAWKSKRPGCLENDDDLLARLSRLGRKWRTSKARIIRAFRISEDGSWLMQKRMIATHETLINFRRQKQEAGAKGGIQRRENSRAEHSGATVSLPANEVAKDTSSSSSAESSPSEKIPPGEQDKPASSQQQALPGLKTPSASKPKKKPGQREVGDLIGHYCRRWVETHKPADGNNPKLLDADKGQLVRLVRDHGAPLAKHYVDRYLDDADPWLFEQRHPLKLLPGQLNRYRATAPPPPPRSRFAPPSPTATTRENRSYSTPVEEVLRDYENIDVSPPTAEWREQMERLGRRAAIAGDA
jgi:uncharacterized protein YdaU (DUF1376 family)